MGKRVVTFGEIMLRLAPEGYYRFVQAESYGASYGGGEANVAVKQGRDDNRKKCCSCRSAVRIKCPSGTGVLLLAQAEE